MIKRDVYIFYICSCFVIVYINLFGILLYSYLTRKYLRNTQTQTDNINNIPLIVIHPNTDIEITQCDHE